MAGAVVIRHADAVEYALVVLGVSFLAAVVVLAWSRAVRRREEHRV